MELAEAFSLAGKTAVVTGAASGIGRATALVLASAGASVVAADINEEGLSETLKQIANAGGIAVSQRTNVTIKDEVDALADRAVSEFGALDVMCNVAGVAWDGLVTDATEEMLDRSLAVNLKGVFFGCQAAVRVMSARGSGSIINVSSSIIDQPAPKYGLYGMAKAAIAHLTLTLALEAGRSGVRVNAIAPGFTVTEFTSRHAYNEDGTLNQERYDAFVKQMQKISPIGRVGEAIDQAYLILYLASDAAKFCTGQIWRANGGQTMGL
ncbi:MAG: SDR family NAD(P)-dependent oxidoreductase [Actinomycetota bacterium]